MHTYCADTLQLIAPQPQRRVMTSSRAAIIAFAFVLCAGNQHVSSFQMPHQAFRIVVPSSRPSLAADTSSASHGYSHGYGYGYGSEYESTRLHASSPPSADANMGEDSNDASLSSSETISDEPIAAAENLDFNSSSNDDLLNFAGLGEFDPNKKIPVKREVLVGNPQLKVKKKEKSVTAILQELAEIQKQGPKKYCILGTRHCSYLHQQIIELLSYALVLSENHVYTSGAGGTNAAAIRGALRAKRPDLLTVILPQSLSKQSREAQELLKDVTDLVAMPQNDEMSLNIASRLCNSKLLSETDQLIAFAFHESQTVIEATKEAKKLEMLVTKLFLD